MVRRERRAGTESWLAVSLSTGRLGAYACLAFATTVAGAQSFPAKPVRIVVPFTTGSATDILARTVGQKLSVLWGQPVVIDNRPGIGGAIGAAVVAKSPPDGYTLLAHSAVPAYNPPIYTGLTFDTLKDFVEVVPLGGQPNVLVVAPSSGFKTVAELIAAAKANPGKLYYGSTGVGSGTHINGEKFRLAIGIDVVHVPYKGTAEALADTITGRVTYFFSPIAAALAHVRDGKLVALAVSTAKRSGALKDTPTVAESGVPGFDYVLWIGLFAPAATPASIVEQVNTDVNQVLRTADAIDRLTALGADAMPMSAVEFRKFARDEIVETGRLIKAAGVAAP